jgi:putative FmdB family regulatory protein
MPTYDYACPGCGGFDALRSVNRRDEPAACPECGAASPRVFAHAPRLALMADSTRSAIETNERARHEPKRSGDYARLKHPSGCGCCSGARRGATVTAPNGAKAFPSKRPWMISH